MKLTIDASVVVKWSVREALFDNARLLRTHRLELHAPDLLLAECVNVVWKKARRGEIADAAGHLNEILRLPEEITLVPISSLIVRAARISVSLDHSVYDCLYLACAQEMSSAFVTADGKLATKVEASSLGIAVRRLGADDFAAEMGMAATAPVISRTQVEVLVEAHRLLAATGEGIRAASDDPEPPDSGALRAYFESAAYRRLTDLLNRLSSEERIDLLALGLFGRQEEWDWRPCFEHACRMVDTAHDRSLMEDGPYWQLGYQRLFGASP